jgi:EmrB/QacA subfamily drug resistance transporter
MRALRGLATMGGMGAASTPPSQEATLTAAQARERDCPVLPCVPFTTVNADLVTAEDIAAPSATDGAPPQRLGLALVVISTAQLMVVLDATIVTVALPSIQRSLHFSTADLQWVLSAYTLTFGGLLLFGGRLGDVFGRRRMFIVGLVLFSGASLAGGLATTSGWLVAARAVQGCGAAIAAPTALALIGDSFEEGPARTRAMGVYAAMSGAGSAIGLLLGGLLTDVASWRWVFFINVPIGLAVAAVAPRALSKTAARGGHLDVPGAVTVTVATTALVYGLVRAPTDGWADPVTAACLIIAAVLFTAFILVESRSNNPLMPLRLFANRNRAATYVVMLCTAAAVFAVFFFLTQLLQNAYGYSPIQAGLAFLPFSLGIAVTSEVVAKSLERVGTRLFSSLGPFLVALGLIWLSRADLHSTYGRDILGPTILLAVGLGCTFVPLTLGATSGVAPADMGIASALLNSSQQIGGTVGLALLVTVATTVSRNWLESTVRSHGPSASPGTLALNAALHGYRTGFLVAAAIALVGGLIALAAIRSVKPPIAMSHIAENGAIDNDRARPVSSN